MSSQPIITTIHTNFHVPIHLHIKNTQYYSSIKSNQLTIADITKFLYIKPLRKWFPSNTRKSPSWLISPPISLDNKEGRQNNYYNANNMFMCNSSSINTVNLAGSAELVTIMPCCGWNGSIPTPNIYNYHDLCFDHMHRNTVTSKGSSLFASRQVM